MSYKLSISGVLRQTLNRVQIYGNTVELVKSLLEPAQYLNDLFYQKTLELRSRNNYSCQKKSLETRLNNLYDASSRRIYIETLPPPFAEFFYSQANTSKTFVFSSVNTINQFYAFDQSTYEAIESSGINFVVYVPPDRLSLYEDEIREEVSHFVYAGKNWVIRSTNEQIIVVLPTF